MNEPLNTLWPLAISLIGVLGAMLISVLAWTASRLHNKIDEFMQSVAHSFEAVHELLRKIERDLRGDLADLDRRVTRTEVRCNLNHDVSHDDD